MSRLLPSTGSEIHASLPARVQATCTFMPVVLCLPEYSSGWEAHDQQGAGAIHDVLRLDVELVSRRDIVFPALCPATA